AAPGCASLPCSAALRTALAGALRIPHAVPPAAGPYAHHILTLKGPRPTHKPEYSPSRYLPILCLPCSSPTSIARTRCFSGCSLLPATPPLHQATTS
ncbi:hypothetical protein, partial [Schleiferia thermophila]|uniref:hypothetical protein n=1 Tax=Schleiferia thermophila TaxID=884107 RepID=UPI002FD89EF2